MLGQVAAQRPRAQRHDDVVERAADGAAHALGVVERHRRVGEAAVGADRGVPRRAWGGRERKRRRIVDLVVGAAQPAAHEVAERPGDRLGEQVGHHPQPAVACRRGQLAQRPHGEADELLRAARGTRASSARSADDRSARASGCHGTGSGFGLPPRSTSSRAASISVPDAPSIVAWWTLVNVAAIRPPSTPSITYSSHSGRDRSSGRAWMRLITSLSCCGVPGGGTA